jgi:acyl-CoA thioesterase I
MTTTSQTRLLFIGDSITDCGRNNDPLHLGTGYVRIIHDLLAARSPATAPKVINQGISGHKVTDLAARWERDVIASDPQILSIKIGINDVWHGLGGRNNGVGIEQYIEVYSSLLEQTRSKLPSCTLILCQPSVIWPPQPQEGNQILQPYVQAVDELAGNFRAKCVVPLHGAFVEARKARPDIDWAPDGVHPSSAGHMLIALTWLKAVGWGL